MVLRTALVLLVLSGVAFGASVGIGDYTGSRTVSGGGLEGEPGTSYATDFKVSWVITDVAGTFTYVWTLSKEDGTALDKAISHTLFEVSPAFTAANILTGSDVVFGGGPDDNGAGNGNPNIPANLFSIKFDFGTTLQTYTLVTDKSPIWGNFYSKDGNAGGGPPPPGGHPTESVWNTGFLLDPDAANADFNKFVPTPDTTGIIINPGGGPVVPLPAGVWLGLAMLAGMAMTRRLRRRRSD